MSVRNLGLARLLWMAVAVLTGAVVAGCGIITPAVPTPTVMPSEEASQGIALAVLYTSDVGGVVEATTLDTDG